jgi:hypothetical protein
MTPSFVPVHSAPIAGGWSAAAVDAVDVKPAGGFALTCSDGSRWRAVVYRNLNGELSLIMATPIRMSAAKP